MKIKPIKQLNTNSTGAIFGALVLIAALAMYFWIVAPQVQYLRAVQQYEPVVDNVAKQQKLLKTKLAVRRRHMKNVTTELDGLRGQLFTMDQARQLFIDLEMEAEQYNVSVQTIDIANQESETVIRDTQDALSIEALQSRITLHGPYNGLIAFIRRVQNRQRKVWLNSLDLRDLEQDNGYLSCGISVTIYIIQETEAGSDEHQ